MNRYSKAGIAQLFIWLLEGIVVGFGAILPGISGGTLCVAFGMYRPLIETLSHIKTGLKKYWLMLLIFIIGIGVGFLGLSGVAGWLMEKNLTLVTCTFIGFIIGTIPELWHDAGEKGRSGACYTTGIACFLVMLIILILLRTQPIITIEPNFAGFLLCGVLWGLSFIVPGLSSSSLLLFFGLYKPMLTGISRLNFGVLIPMAIGMGLCILLLSKIMGIAYKKYYSIVSHGVIGIVIATTVMLFPTIPKTTWEIIAYFVCIIAGAAVSFGFTRLCSMIKERTSN